MTKITGTIDDKKALQRFSRLNKKASNLRPVLLNIAENLLRDVEENFEKEQSKGKPWKDLKASTKKARARKRKWPGLILQASGSLSTSVNSRITKNSVIIGSNKNYAPTHQFGNRKKNVPARPFLTISKSRISEANRDLSKHLLS